MTFQSARRDEQKTNKRQRWMRRRSRQLSLRDAVRLAVRVFFRFKYRGVGFSALWCDTEHLWMGRETFIHWALCDESIHLPWAVREAADAPPDTEDFLEAVVAELNAYWDQQSAFLPRTRHPDWLPLP